MAGIPGGPGILRRGWLRLVDGDSPWGSIIVCPERMGVIHYRLVIYPPGISETERRRLRVWRGWPMWGALLWIASLRHPRWADRAADRAGNFDHRLSRHRCRGVHAGRWCPRPGPRDAGDGDVRLPDPLSENARRKLSALAATLIEADQPPTGTDLADRVRDDLVAGVRRD